MISDRQLFKRAKEVIKYMGKFVDVLELDPFEETKRIAFINDNIRIEWSRVLAGDEAGQVHIAEIIGVFTDEFSDYGEFESVFHTLLTDKNTVETFKFIPGEWITPINNISREIKIRNP